MHGRLFQPYRGKEEEEEEEEGDLRFVLETVNMKNQFSLFKKKGKSGWMCPDGRMKSECWFTAPTERVYTCAYSIIQL